MRQSKLSEGILRVILLLLTRRLITPDGDEGTDGNDDEYPRHEYGLTQASFSSLPARMGWCNRGCLACGTVNRVVRLER